MNTGDTNGYCGAYGCLRNAYSERFDEIASSSDDVATGYNDEAGRLLEYVKSYKSKIASGEKDGLSVAIEAAKMAYFELRCRVGSIAVKRNSKSKGGFTRRIPGAWQ